MYQAFLVKYAEIGIKGKNRYKFENALCTQMERTLKPVDGEFHVQRQQGRIFVEAKGDFDEEDVIEALRHVFGISGICPVNVIEDKTWRAWQRALVTLWSSSMTALILPLRWSPREVISIIR